jgi:hypothetical protein
MNIGFERIVLCRWIDIEKSPNTWGKLDLSFVNDSPSGIYPIVIVPENLRNRKVLIIPLDEEDKPMTLFNLTKL